MIRKDLDKREKNASFPQSCSSGLVGDAGPCTRHTTAGTVEKKSGANHNRGRKPRVQPGLQKPGELQAEWLVEEGSSFQVPYTGHGDHQYTQFLRSSLVARCSFSHFCYEERGEGSKRTSVLRSRQSLISALELLLLILLHGTHARARAHAHTHPHPHPTAWSDIVSAMTRNSP
jgi:hypothetical protein